MRESRSRINWFTAGIAIGVAIVWLVDFAFSVLDRAALVEWF
jgi:hypothetical protein